MKPFAKGLKAHLRLIGMSQLDLACRTSLTRAVLCQIINGKRDPSFQSLLKILKALNVTLDYLMELGERYER